MRRPRGPRPRLSRDRVVAAALDILQAEGTSGVTMARVAEAVDASPMSLYRHVRGREELLESMLDELLERLDFDLPQGRAWQRNVRAWMENVRDHFLEHPQILSLIEFEPGSYMSPPWIRACGTLVGPVRSAGFEGEALARALLWISRNALGTLLQEIAGPIADRGALLGGVARLAPEDAAVWVDVLPDLGRMDDDGYFQTVVDETIRTLERWLEESEGNTT